MAMVLKVPGEQHHHRNYEDSKQYSNDGILIKVEEIMFYVCIFYLSIGYQRLYVKSIQVFSTTNIVYLLYFN